MIVPDPTPNDGFTIELQAAEQAATQSLPTAAAALRVPIHDLVSHVDFEGVNAYSASYRAMKAFGLYKESVGRRQMDIARVVDETAEALMDIVTVYKRADGQA